jgi:hypothetical protein
LTAFVELGERLFAAFESLREEFGVAEIVAKMKGLAHGSCAG